MKKSARIQSVLHAVNLQEEVTNFPSFTISELKNVQVDIVEIATNVRLGQLIEKIVAQLIRSSSNYLLIHENVQIIQNKQTIGELDFIIQEKATNSFFHVEFAYKFYLLDPTISSNQYDNWIGPNRKDTLREKIEKLQEKQFPLLYHEHTKTVLHDLHIEHISQKLCMLAYLFIPYHFSGTIHPHYQKAIKGYYVNFPTFIELHTPDTTYYFPPKKMWGMEPSENNTWHSLPTIKATLKEQLETNRSVLCWQKRKDVYSLFFIVWW
ncbi:DUF1853 family protein [Kordia zhangzhouensis]|uniref:DUF1853 family protein n=1 Tax=Kordia zhangzhouensis TaxID=1620405 RepID=UPI000629B514|nr:DUF1853 family protein [Kordia zhangzhouensis]